ncbi:MAG: outer membrane beta-barrel protein [Saprospiraceae bacterium]|nr:outer membrane beta-barrel protein [Saprospiraceae bacterium]
MSDQDKNTEEIKALLRKKLEGLPPADDGWNVPSPGVWTGLSEELKAVAGPKPATNWVARLATIIAALMVILFWRECSNQRQLMGLKSEVEKMSNSYDKLQEACNEKQSNVQPASLEDNNGPILNGDAAAAGTTVSPNKKSTKKGQNAKSINLSNTSNKSVFTSKSTSNHKITAGAINIVPAISLGTQTAEIGAPLVQISSNLGSLDFLPLLSFSRFDHQPTKPQLDLHLPNPKNQGASVQFIASLLGGLALTGNQLSGQKPAIIKDQKALLTWRSGFGVEAAFNRHWSLLTGLDYGLSRIETQYQLAVPYRHNGETQHDDGNFDNQYNHSLPSSLGNYPAQLVLTRTNGVDVAEGEVMNLELTIRQKTRLLSLPLQLRYGFGKDRWQIGAKAGFFANHVLGISNEKPKLISKHGAIHERHTSIGTPPLNDLQQWTFDWALGTDIRYQLTRRFGLSLNAAYQQGITPVYKDEAVKNYLHAWNLGAGVHYWLR